jgi:uncharacterized OB-fold protein
MIAAGLDSWVNPGSPAEERTGRNEGMAEQKAEQQKRRPVVPFLKIPDRGDPYLEGQQCSDCEAIFVDPRAICSSCGARDRLKTKRLSNRGELYVYSIIHRSFPGIPTPYVSAIVDLEGGGTVKGNLVNIDPVPDKIQMGMPVEVIYDVAPRKDAEGNEYLTYYFQPRNS